MSIYINDRNKISDIYINANNKKKINSCWVNKNGVPTKVFSTGNIVNGIKIVTWANGTDEEIAAMLDAHYSGEINIHDYWHVGDERVIHLNEIEACDAVKRGQPEQDVIMVLLHDLSEIPYHQSYKYFTNPINTFDRPAFIIGQKYALINPGIMNTTSQNSCEWRGSIMRTWLNGQYRNAFPSNIRQIFKLHQNARFYKDSGYYHTTEDYFVLPSEYEIYGKTEYAYNDEGYQFSYYKTKENIPKTYFWTSSMEKNNPYNFCVSEYLSSYNECNSSVSSAGVYNYIVPNGCI